MKDFLVIGGLIGMMACTNRVTSRQAEFDRNMFCSSEEAKQAICEKDKNPLDQSGIPVWLRLKDGMSILRIVVIPTVRF